VRRPLPVSAHNLFLLVPNGLTSPFLFKRFRERYRVGFFNLVFLSISVTDLPPVNSALSIRGSDEPLGSLFNSVI